MAQGEFDTLILELTEGSEAIALEVARDVAGTAALEGVIPTARAAVRWLLAELRAGERVRPAALEVLREEADQAARAGRPVASVLDPYLSAGWAVWEAAAVVPAASASLPRLGAILLRAGDAAAAAIAAAYADADAAMAARNASARREFLDELIAARPGDAALVRLGRRGAAHGLGTGVPTTIVLIALARDLDDDDPAIATLGVALGPRVSFVATDRGRALVIGRAGSAREPALRAALDRTFGRGNWSAVVETVPDGLPGIGRAVVAAHATLAILVRLGRRGTLASAERVLLEQAILADSELLAEGVASVLAPLRSAPRSGVRLVETLRVFLETAGNRRETARRLGLAPRTVAYRLARMERLLGTRLAGAALLRLAAALFAGGLLAPPEERSNR